MSTLSDDLLQWYRDAQRSMPWRDQPGPYRTWISEAMLQQTQVDTVRPYFNRFMSSFPTVQVLAAADLETVLKHWAGLGYYSRARNLHKSAQEIVAQGGFPATVEGWRALAGVGPYMAGAIASIALGLDVPTVDGNIARVLSRVHREASTGKTIWDLAAQHIPKGQAGDHNQALMDLGATVCTPRSPDCAHCPIASHCKALHVGDIQQFPAPKARKKSPIWTMACALIESEAGVLVGRRPPAGLFGGLWEPPMFRVHKGDAASALANEVATMGMTVTHTEALVGFRHILTHRTLNVKPFATRVTGEASPGSYTKIRWVPRPALADLPLSVLAEKALSVYEPRTEIDARR